MAAKLIVQDFVGANGIVTYGSALFFVDDWNVKINLDTIDITNISIYEKTADPLDQEPLPYQVDSEGNEGDNDLPFPDNLPDTSLPYQIKNPPDRNREQSQYMAARLNIDSGLKVANIVCAGLCAAFDEEDKVNYMPRVGNYVRIQFSNTIDSAVTIFNFPKVLIKDVTFDFNIKNYTRWTFTGVSTGDFDMFPGKGE